jgi:hypothetical protein
MNLLWSRNGAKPLSSDLRKALEKHNFRLETEQKARLRYVSKSGIQGRSRVQSVRIFDPALLVNQSVIEKYDDLNESHQAVVAEGYIERGMPYLHRA